MSRAWRALVVVWLMLWAGLASAASPLFLWELRDGAGGLRAWLYGTIHVCDAACFPLPAPVQGALAEADSLALELDLEDPAVMRRLGEAAVLPAGTQLDTRLPPALRPRLVLASTRLGLPPEAVQRLQPWMVSTLLTIRVAELAGFRTEQGVDLWLARQARERGKPLWALETVERQIQAMAGGGDAAQVASLTEVIELIESGEARAYFRRMLDAWRGGDVAALDVLLREEMASADMAPLFEEMLDRRNREMVDTLLRRLEGGGRPFVAVGAGHFGGSAGLLAELTRRGYTLTQVEAPAAAAD
ncbi:MAG: TraB/GumN family protein [Zoogloea sp.]|uniref:TraB/GumN family protein n=1 Tax=Zoogloea sp. TaxID=49181 RepID=UPI00260BE325|nr:TraB/GumN family protein [Zoogloea sp.]MDD2989368.1 TraB/GumN family protein [Zoogloea sp.]